MKALSAIYGVFFMGALAAGNLTAQTIYAPGGTVGNIGGSNVGIGTSSPGQALTVAGALVEVTGTASFEGISLNNTSGSGGREFRVVSNDTTNLGGGFIIYDQTAGAARLKIDSSGNVGMGTTSPLRNLHIFGGGFPELLIESTYTAANNGRMWGLYADNSTGNFGIRAANSTLTTANGVMTLTPSGYVGIGTGSPSAMLDVTERVHFGPGTDNVANTTFGISAQDSGGNPVAVAVGKTTGRSVGLIWYDSVGTNGAAYLYTFSNAAPLVLSAASISICAGTANDALFVNGSGNVGIGTTSPAYKLAVNGTVRAKEVIVDTGWSDYVFADDYHLEPLSEVEAHIKANRHLPGIPSAQQVEEHGISVGEMQARLLAKIEELTLHQIEQEKQLQSQAARIAQLERENLSLRHP